MYFRKQRMWSMCSTRSPLGRRGCVTLLVFVRDPISHLSFCYFKDFQLGNILMDENNTWMQTKCESAISSSFLGIYFLPYCLWCGFNLDEQYFAFNIFFILLHKLYGVITESRNFKITYISCCLSLQPKMWHQINGVPAACFGLMLAY